MYCSQQYYLYLFKGKPDLLIPVGPGSTKRRVSPAEVCTVCPVADLRSHDEHFSLSFCQSLMKEKKESY